MILNAFKWGAGLLALAGVAGAGYLWIAPPDLFRVATNYSAKIVCSNVFIAGRDAQNVLAIDVQAPGHPLLKQISMQVDAQTQSVKTTLFGVFAPAVSQYRDGLGCTNVHNAALENATLPVLSTASEGLWPTGEDVAVSQNPDVIRVLNDPGLRGEGFRAAVVVHNGRIVGEAYGEGFSAGTPLLGWSMTKTVTAVLIGRLVQTEQLSLDDPLVDNFPDWGDDARDAITLRHMLAMSSGLEWNEGYGSVSDVTRMLYLTDNMSDFVTGKDVTAEVGTEFTYSSGTSTALSKVWQNAVGKDSLRYPQQALFAPLGMQSAVMETDAAGTFVGSSYMYATARDWARFGQFLLQKGVWNDVALLPEGFTDWMFKPTEVSEGMYTNGHMWRGAPNDAPPFEDAIWARGHDGQSIVIFPSRGLVVVRMGLTPSKHAYSPLPLAQALIEAISD